MKVRCYEPVPLPGGVEMLRLADTDLPLRAVVDKGIASIPASGELSQLCAGPWGEHEFAPATIRVKDAHDGEVEIKGFLLYERTSDLVEFLATRYVPSGSGALDDLLRASASDARAVLRRVLRDADEWPRGRPSARTAVPRICFAIPRRFLNQWEFGLRRVDGRYFYSVEERQALVVDRETPYGDCRIARRAFVLVFWGRPGRLCIWFDGDAFGCAPSVGDLPVPLADELDRAGRAVVGGELRDPLPRPPLRPLFIVRAPARSEVMDVPARNGAGPPHPTPFFLVDTREPVPMPLGLPVIQDVGHALEILARVSGDVYVPHDLAATPAMLEDDARWLLACEVVT